MQMTTELSNIDSYTRFSDVRMSIEQEAAVRFIHNIQSTILRFAHSVPVVCAEIHRCFDSRMETMHKALNLLLFEVLIVANFPPSHHVFDKRIK